MRVAVADTHAAIWYVSGNSRLSARARLFMRDAEDQNAIIAISSITLVEIVYLIDKGRIDKSSLTALRSYLEDPLHFYEEIQVSGDIADAMRQVPRDQIPDMPDRIIAATAVHLKVPLISRDGRIRASNMSTIW